MNGKEEHLKMYQNVPIVMTMDQNYVIPTKVAIWSILKKIKRGIGVRIFILCSSLLERKYRDDILCLMKYNSNLCVEFLEVDSSIFDKAKTIGRIPVASFYRLLIAELINTDKCLFLDGDIIVNGDIYPLLTMDMGENYIAGVKDKMVFQFLLQSEEHRKKLDIPNIEGYVNAGVMIFNLKKIREDKLVDRFLDFLDKGFRFMDQDILNKVCYGKILHLGLQYNLFASYYGVHQEAERLIFSEEEIEVARKEVVIIHYVTNTKPWNNIRVKKSDLWWESAKEIIDKSTYDNMYQRVKREASAYNEAWQNILKKCGKEEEVIISGFTDNGKEVLDLLMEKVSNNIVCFCDNLPSKQTQNYKGIPVYSPINALKKYPSAIWLITNQYSGNEIARQLKGLGVREEKILFYKKQF